MSPFTYFKIKLQKVLQKASNAFWWVAAGALAVGVGGRVIWEIVRFGWNLPAWVFHWARHLFA